MINYEKSESNIDAPSIEELEAALSSAGIDVSTWGQGSAKTLSHLHKEIVDRESVVNLSENGAERRLSVAGVDVFYADQAGNVYRLVEDRQEFKDGRPPRRRQQESSLSEKMKVGEDPEEAANRAIAEEIGVGSTDYFYYLDHKEVATDSPSFPGLASVYDTYTYAAILGDDDFNPEGYVEEQADKTNYYQWVMIHSADNN